MNITSAGTGELFVTVYALNGAEVSSRNVELNEGFNTVTENISSLKNGIYFVKVYNSATNETSVRKLVKN